LVGITAGCAFVETTGAAFIGISSGLVVYLGTILLERVFNLDDVVGAVPVHAFCGAWGTIAVALFITQEQLALQGISRLKLLGIQSLGVSVCFIWTFFVALFLLHIINLLITLRVDPEEEKLGLNIAEHGATSSVLELAQSMQQVTDRGSYGQAMKVDVEHGTEIGDLAECFNQMIGAIQDQQRRAGEEFRKYQEYMETNVEEVRAVIERMQDRLGETGSKAESMAESFQNAARTMESLVDSLRDISTNTTQASSIAQDAVEAAEKSRSVVDVLSESANEVYSIITTINEIAEQTQILSLNATIEAVHAGEAGRGFSVVANEVKSLAKQSTRATDQIGSRVREIQENMDGTISAIRE
ncbi:MAG: methyl-accepting chemotaxis protein, partial [Planctomycetota bacterium]|nr:methyl-accepting chemotaxis protein [Planctomycetota bacterium]